MTLVGRVHVKPDGVDADTERLTVPVKAFRAFRVIVDVPEPPARIWLGLTVPVEMLKSGRTVTWNVMLAVVWESVPLVPVTVLTKSVVLLTVALHESVAVCGEVPRTTLAGSVQVIPDTVEAERLTVPVKPLTAVTVMV